MRTFKDLLEEKLRRPKSVLTDEDFRISLIAYISVTESILGDNVWFVRRLTKAAHHLFQTDHSSLDEPLLERLYRFDVEAAGTIEDQIGEVMDGIQTEEAALGYTFYSGAASIAEQLYKLTRRIGWLMNAYECRERAAELSVSSYPFRSARSFGVAGNHAYAVAVLTNHPDWWQKARECYEPSIAYFRANPKQPKAYICELVRTIEERLPSLYAA